MSTEPLSPTESATLYVNEAEAWVHAITCTVHGAEGPKDVAMSVHPIIGKDTAASIVAFFQRQFPDRVYVFNAVRV